MPFHAPRAANQGTAQQADRWMLWVDGVGGFLVLAGGPWSLGGPAAEAEAGICVQAALSRRAAEIDRVGRDYSLRRFSDAAGGESQADRKSGEHRGGSEKPLRGHDAFWLGNGVHFDFCCPHPLSTTARLTLDRRFRFRPHADAIILLADTLLIGATRDCHLLAPHAERTQVLFRRDGEWFCQPLAQSETPRRAPLAVAEGGRIEVGDVALTMERA